MILLSEFKYESQQIQWKKWNVEEWIVKKVLKEF